jgi:carboxypeptidase PM20D1
VLALAAVLVANALRPPPPLPPPLPGEPLALPLDAAIARLASALRFQTVSHADPALARPQELVAFQAFLRDSFPRVHTALARERVGGGSLLYTWRGARPELPPVLLLAHQDVVPVERGSRWTHPPFAGTVAGGYVWGRGAIDDKQSVMGILEAVEALLAAGWAPPRTVYLAFGHDEELGGDGAQAIARLLAARGPRPAFVLDEGGFYARGLVPGLAAPAALVGIAEKGYLSLELEVRQEGGHSSQPPAESAIGLLARAVARLEENPFPPRLDGPSRAALEGLAPHLGFGERLALSNLWLLEPVVARALAARQATASAVRTTTALTMIDAGEKDNVLPQRARAVVNFRLLPGDTVAGVTARVREVVGDERVAVRPLELPHPGGGTRALASEPSRPSSTRSAAWRLVTRAIRQAWADAPGGGGELVVAPLLFTGATDGRHFEAVADDVYRFTGVTIAPEDVARFHGSDERIAVDDYRRVVAVYHRVLRGLDTLDAPARE